MSKIVQLTFVLELVGKFYFDLELNTDPEIPEKSHRDPKTITMGTVLSLTLLVTSFSVITLTP
jgi:hypothetical protein